MLLNFSNHPVSTWQAEQIRQAKAMYGEVIDQAFPEIDPNWPKSKLQEEARKWSHTCDNRLKEATGQWPDAVHVMGELTFCYAVVQALKGRGITCIASTTHRHVTVKEDGEKRVQFQFVRFREY
jgi:hypothetical protein